MRSEALADSSDGREQCLFWATLSIASFFPGKLISQKHNTHTPPKLMVIKKAWETGGSG